MARSRRHEEVDLRNRAKALGYDIYGLDNDGYVLAKRLPDGRRTVVVGKDGGVTLDAIERWLDKNDSGGGESD